MAFCKYCGTQIEEGAVCHCKDPVQNKTETADLNLQTHHENSSDSAQSMNQSHTESKENQSTETKTTLNINQEKIKENSKKAAAKLPSIPRNLISVLKNPITGGLNFINNADKLESIFLMMTQAILLGLLITIPAIRYSMILSFILMGLNPFIAFILTFIASFAIGLGFSGLVYLLEKTAKQKLSFTKALAYGGLRAISIIPFLVIALLLNAMLPLFSYSLLGLTPILTTLFVACVYLARDNGVDPNRKVYILFALFTLTMILSALVMKVTLPLYIPGEDGTDLIYDIFDVMRYF